MPLSQGPNEQTNQVMADRAPLRGVHRRALRAGATAWIGLQVAAGIAAIFKPPPVRTRLVPRTGAIGEPPVPADRARYQTWVPSPAGGYGSCRMSAPRCTARSERAPWAKLQANGQPRQ